MIRIGFSKANGLPSEVIRGVTNSLVSHVFVAYSKVDGTTNVIEACSTGIVESVEAEFRKSNTIVAEVELEVSTYSEKAMIAFARSQLGHPYDWASIVGFGWVLLNRVWHSKVSNPFHERGAYVCSVFGLDVLRHADEPAFLPLFKLDLRATEPEDLLEALTKLVTPKLKWIELHDFGQKAQGVKP